MGWPGLLRAGLVCVVLFFCADLFQYVLAAVRRRSWIRAEEERHHEDHGTIEGEYQIPVSLDRPVFGLWCAKLCFLFLSFVFAGIGVWAT